VAGSDLAVEVSASVRNTGEVAGAEVVQVYVRDVEASVNRPVRELKAFRKVWLEPGESTTVTMALDTRSFAYWSVVRSDWVVEAGDFEIAVGTSSRHLAASETINLSAPSVAGPLGMTSSLSEWMANPRGRELVMSLDAPLMRDPELVKIIGSMPMDRLCAFGSFGFNAATLEQMTQQLTASER
jgi:beta-glucosidase